MIISNNLAKNLGPINDAGIKVSSTLNQGSEFWFIVEDKSFIN